MMRSRTKLLGAILFAGILAACSRSPEARRDKHLAKGKELFAKGKYSSAILEFKSAGKAVPNDAEAYYQLGVASAAIRDFRTAIGALNRALELNPKHQAAQLRLSQLLAATNEETWLRDAESRLKTLSETGMESAEVLNTLALTELKLGKTASAVQTLEQALAKLPDELSSSVLLARAKLLQQDVGSAEDVLKRAVAAAPDKAGAHIILGRFYLSQKRIVEAEAQFQEAVRLNPNSGPALMDLASLQNSQGRKAEAEEKFKRLADFPEGTYSAVYGLYLYAEGRTDGAVGEFEKRVKQNPDDRMARSRLVTVYRAVNQVGNAEKVLGAALQKNPRDLDALVQRGQIYLAAKKLTLAEADITAVLRMQPDSVEAHYAVAKLHQARGNTRMYRQELSETLRLMPHLVSVRTELVRDLLENGATAAAAEVLDSTPESQRQLTPVLVQRNWLYWASGNMGEMRKGIDSGLSRQRSPDLLVQDALWKLRAGNVAGGRAALEEALKMNPSDTRALATLHRTYTQKEHDLALQKVKEYAALQPNSAPVQEFLGSLYLAKSDRKQARAAFEAANTAEPTFGAADLSLIQVDIVEGKLDDARRRLQALLASDPTNPQVRLWLGSIDLMKRDYKSALEQFRQVVEAEPNNAQALNNLAYLLVEYSKSPTEALKYAQKAVELAPDQRDYCDTLGWILYQKGLYTAAVPYLEKASSDPRNVTGKYHLAMTYAKTGDRRRAKTMLEAALKLNSAAPEAAMAREVVGQP